MSSGPSATAASSARSVRRRRFWVPEAIQTSAMDCGVAVLQSALSGFGLRASYGRLREACQTDVDGTSIETLEALAADFGLGAEQVIVPTDFLFAKDPALLPCIAIVQVGRDNHFVLLWRTFGPIVQVMDPAFGRRFMTQSELLRQVIVHEQEADASEWFEWATTDEFCVPLRGKLDALGVDSSAERVEAARSSADLWPLARLDAAVRVAQALVAARALTRGAAVEQLLERLCGSRAGAVPPGDLGGSIPERYWSVRPLSAERVIVRGTVLVRLGGPSAAASSAPSVLRPELREAIGEAGPGFWATLWDLLAADGRRLVWGVLAGLVVVAVGTALEAVLFRSLFELGRYLGLVQQRITAVGLLMGFLGVLAMIELPIGHGLASIGRRLELRLRMAFLKRLPELPVRYFQSRTSGDMADRSHGVQALHEIPRLVEVVLRTALEILAMTVGLCWVAPQVAHLALTLAVVVVAVPAMMHPFLSEREVRLQSLSGSLTRFYLDALLGIVPVRTHGVERPLRHEQEAAMVPWTKAASSSARVAALGEAVQGTVGLGLAGWLVWSALTYDPNPSGVLLMTYWALMLPALGQQLMLAMRAYPRIRNRVLRVLEPMGASSERASVMPVPPEASETQGSSLARASHEDDSARGNRAACRITYEDVRARIGGHEIVRGVTLRVEPGEHVAFVGASGAGKSTILRLLLGWDEPSGGTLAVDGEPLRGEVLARLRREVVWLDPSVQLWNRSVVDNLRYGSPDFRAEQMSEIVDLSDLATLVAKLPDGLQTPLGEGGALVSGGEGQRVRFGRASAKPSARLVVLDEPFRGLDREQRTRLIARTRARFQAQTLVCATHDVEETRAFDRVVVIAQGCVVEDGRPSDLAARSDSVYAGMLRAEAELRGAWSGFRHARMEGGRFHEVESPSGTAREREV